MRSYANVAYFIVAHLNTDEPFERVTRRPLMLKFGIILPPFLIKNAQFTQFSPKFIQFNETTITYSLLTL